MMQKCHQQQKFFTQSNYSLITNSASKQELRSKKFIDMC
jgi:hypothetical protein